MLHNLHSSQRYMFMQRSHKKKINITPTFIEDALPEIKMLANTLAATNNAYEELDTATKLSLLQLGNVHLTDDQLYFKESTASKHCAKQFFTLLINTPATLDLVSQHLTSKQDRLSIDQGERKKVAPSCISFVTASFPKKPHVCFIAVSRHAGGEDHDLLAALDKIAIQLNKFARARNDIYEYVVVMESSPAFKDIIKSLTSTTRTCAEYDYGALLAKLFSEYGNQLKVEGIVNCALYNFSQKKDLIYKRKGKGQYEVIEKLVSQDNDTVITNNRSKRKLTMKNMPDQHEIILMDCCYACKINKNAFMATLVYAAKQGDKLNLGKKSEAKKSLRLSGIKERDMAGTSLYTMFQTCEQHDDKVKIKVPVKKQAAMIQEDKSKSVNMLNDKGHSPLHSAVLQGNLTLVNKLLFNEKTDINLPTTTNETALHLAVSQHNDDMVKLLLANNKINVDAQPHTQKTTPLSLAWSNGDKNTALLLLDAKANVNLLTIQNRIELLAYALSSTADKAKTATYLSYARQVVEDNSIKINVDNNDFICIIKRAIESRDIDFISTLGDRDKSIFFKVFHYEDKNGDRSSFTLMHIALQYQAYNIIECLLASNSKIVRKEVGDITPLFLAKTMNNPAINDIFVRFGCFDPEIKSPEPKKKPSFFRAKEKQAKVELDDYFCHHPGQINSCNLF